MGYRSQVTVVIYGDTDDVTAFVATERLIGKPKGMKYHPFFEPTGNWMDGQRDVYIYDYEKTMMKWSWQEIKYRYFDNREVRSIFIYVVWEDAFSNTSLCMEIARVGEETGDVEVNYYGDSDYCLSIESGVNEENMPERSISGTNLKGEQNE